MISVAIDGPSGAGKSTLARAAANKLGYTYVDTGACYRAIALHFIRQQIDYHDPQQVEQALSEIWLNLKYQDGEQRVFLNGEDVSEAIRTPEVTEVVSPLSALPIVREWLLEFQRRLADDRNVIMDGRDIGTVVLPQADVKIYLTASPEERAKRRLKDFLAKGIEIDYNKVLEDMRQRDKRDSTRKVAPLQQAEDAVLLDTTTLDFQQSLARMLEIIKGRE